MAKVRKDLTSQRDLRRVLDSDEFIDAISIGLVFQNQRGEITDYKRTALELLGLTSEAITGRKASDPRRAAVHEDGSPYLDEDNPTVVTSRTGERCVDAILGIENPDRARRWISISTHPVLSDGVVTGVVAAFIDVSDRIQKERLLPLLTSVNRFAMFAEDEDDLFQCVCDLLVQRSGYALAWIGVENGDNIHILGAAGATDYLFEDIISSSPNTITGGGPGASPCKPSSSRWRTDCTTSPRSAPGVIGRPSSVSNRLCEFPSQRDDRRCCAFTTATSSPSIQLRCAGSRTLRARCISGSPIRARSRS